MQLQWYYTQNGESKGPVQESDLRRMAGDGSLKPSDHVWNQTMGDEWARASTVPGLFDAQPAAATRAAPAISTAHLAGPVSCRAAVRPAWERMKSTLFLPFRLAKWFALGVSAWLATLGEGGGNSFSTNLKDLKNRQAGGGRIRLNEIIEPIRQFWDQYNQHILVIGIVVVVLGIIFGLVITWLRARGKFMFLDNVVHDRAEISVPWREFAQHGNSLFWWYVLYSVACLLVFAILLGLAVIAIGLPCYRAGGFVRSTIPSIAMVGTVWLVVAVVTAYISRFVEDFVIPISYHSDLTMMEAWTKFHTLLKPNFGALVVYGLFYLLLGFVVVFAILAFILLTCCVGACFMAIPYVGAVVMLPVTVFFRAYSLEYLSQYGKEFRVFRD